MSIHKEKVVVVLGPTASGKSDLAVSLAKKFIGEVISADSRQVYKDMDIGSGKIPRDQIRNQKSLPDRTVVRASEARNNFKILNSKFQNFYYYKGIRHHLLDVASPKRDFHVVRYKKLAQKAIHNIEKRSTLPIICGGTGFYIDALIYDIDFPAVKANKMLRKELEKKSVKELFSELKKRDPRRAITIDSKNKRRLIRALEITYNTRTFAPMPTTPRPSAKNLSVPILHSIGTGKKTEKKSPYTYLKIGIKKNTQELRSRIDKRLKDRLRQGLIKEVLQLRKSGISWKRLENFGLEYRYVSLFLQKKLPESCYTQTKPEMKKIWPYSTDNLNALYFCLSNKIWQYAKRQMTWWKKDKEIHWVKNYKQAEVLVKKFLN